MPRTKPSEEELEAGAARVLAEVRAELAAEEEAVQLELEEALAAEAVTADANRITGTLGWTERHLAVVEHAVSPGIVDTTDGYRMRPGGRRIATDTVDDLVHAGFLEDADADMVVASADGHAAMRAVRASTLPFRTPEQFAAHRHDVNRSRAVASRRTLQLLPPLSGGQEETRRTAAARERLAQLQLQACASRAEAQARQDRLEAELAAERATEAAEAAATEEERARISRHGCGDCPDHWEVAARCGACRAATAPAPYVPLDDGWDDDTETGAGASEAPTAHLTHPAGREAVQASRGPGRTPAVRTEVTRHHTTGGRGYARVTFPAARAHRARDHRHVVLALASLHGVQTSTPRRLLADGTHTGAELWRHMDVTGPTRAVKRFLAALPVLEDLERMATRAARRLGTWRRSLAAVLSGYLDALSPAQRAVRARQFRSAVLEALVGFVRAEGAQETGVDHRVALWDQASNVAAAVWAEVGGATPGARSPSKTICTPPAPW